MKRIFLVDHDHQMRGLIRHALAVQQYDVSDFELPSRALAAVLTSPPDLLISNVQLPEMTGLDLAATIREEAAPDLPVVLIASKTSTETVAKARELGIRHVIQKPAGEFTELFTAVRRELFSLEAVDAVQHLDGLRKDFFVDLSHQLRTPMTAMKLAMDGLFSDLHSVMSPSQQSLAKISRRNIERVLALVENQLNLLQMITGEMPVCRRMVDVDALVRSLSEKRFESNTEVVRADREDQSGPFYIYTDPDVLETLVDCALGAGSPNSPRTIRLDYDAGTNSCSLDLHVEYLPPSAVLDGHGHMRQESVPLFDFEQRAYSSLLAVLDGHVTMEKDDNYKWVRFRLPRYPAYDRQMDFLSPVRRMQSLAYEGGVNTRLHFVKCDLGDRARGDYLDFEDAHIREFFERIDTVLAVDEAVIRTRHHNAIYLSLLGRSEHELEHVIRYLNHGLDCSDDRDGRKPHVKGPQTVVPDPEQIDKLVGELESV
jgi:CheY-like chemotaxis protein